MWRETGGRRGPVAAPGPLDYCVAHSSAASLRPGLSRACTAQRNPLGMLSPDDVGRVRRSTGGPQGAAALDSTPRSVRRVPGTLLRLCSARGEGEGRQGISPPTNTTRIQFRRPCLPPADARDGHGHGHGRGEGRGGRGPRVFPSMRPRETHTGGTRLRHSFTLDGTERDARRAGRSPAHPSRPPGSRNHEGRGARGSAPTPRGGTPDPPPI